MIRKLVKCSLPGLEPTTFRFVDKRVDLSYTDIFDLVDEIDFWITKAKALLIKIRESNKQAWAFEPEPRLAQLTAGKVFRG